jgi:starvation-inducible DNA-binding protein
MTYSDSFAQTQMQPTIAMESEQESIQPEIEQPKTTVQGMVEILIDYASYLHQLYAQSHLIHLNIEGPLFFPIHDFLKEQYEAHIVQFDKTSEFVRTLDYLMPMCQRGLLQAHKGIKQVKDYDTRNMLTTYLKNLEDAGMTAKDVLEYARDLGAIDVENYMAELAGDMFKAAWMLKSTLRSK